MLRCSILLPNRPTSFGLGLLGKIGMKPNKLKFKRKKSGGGDGWGAGWDDVLKEYWDDLDQITEDSFYGRHNSELIKQVLQGLRKALEGKAIPRMEAFYKKVFSKKEKEEMKDWIKKAKKLRLELLKARTLSDKVIVIDSITQFLRATQERPLDLEELQISLEKKIRGIKQIKGIVASKGVARGKVKIVIKIEDLKKVKKGDILVADETDPDFLPAMRKAKAIITDMGGVLCHAAIVSRELGIPCITGTKIATKVLRDGDLVEVDANKGRVRILD